MDINRAAEAIEHASHLLITAGAGMGVDSGLPDFRGSKGFWKAYPPYEKLSLGFIDLANPDFFMTDPALAWGFYGHRLALYRETIPHAGFEILRRWSAKKKSYFIATSNVDGQFQKAGFDPQLVNEVHGSIHYLQCSRHCSHHIFPAEGVEVEIDTDTMRAIGHLPTCPSCGSVARPNILMFGDFGYIPSRQVDQQRLYRSWHHETRGEPLVVVELGAGVAVPTIRMEGENVARGSNAHLVRINPRDANVPSSEISLPMGALAGLQALDEKVNL